MTIKSLFGSLFGSSTPQPVVLMKALATNSTDQTFSPCIVLGRTAPEQTVPLCSQQPTGAGVFDTNLTGSLDDPGQLKVYPYCNGQPGSGFAMNIWGWSMCGNSDPTKCHWMPSPLIQVVCIAGNIAGSDGLDAFANTSIDNATVLLNTENFCNRIFRTAGSVGFGQIVQGTSRSPAYLTVDIRQCVAYQIEFAQGSKQSGLSMNALFALI